MIRGLLSLACGLPLAVTATAQVTVTVHGDQTFQTIAGWGGNTYSWILNGWNGWTDPSVYDLAFDELGTTHVRMVTEFDAWELRNDDEDPQHINWAYFETRFEGSDNDSRRVQSDFDMLEKISAKYGKEIMVGIWDVPNWMVSDSTKTDHRDLPYTLHEEFAESVAAYLLWARDRRGVHIPEIVLANEPNGFLVEYTPEELRDLIKTVGQRFEREGLETRIIAPDLASPYYDPEVWVTTLLEDSAAAKHLGAISYHTYYVSEGPDRWNAEFARIAELAASHNLPVYFTEVGTTPWNIPNETWEWAFECAQMWHNLLTVGQANLAHQWALLGKDYAINPDATRNPIFYALQQFFLHIPPGAVRLGVTSEHEDLLVSAFRHEGSGQVTLVFINRAATDLQANVVLEGLAVPSVTVYRSGAEDQHVDLGSYEIKNGGLAIAIPANSIVTLLGQAAEFDSQPPAPPSGVSVHGN